MKMMGYWMFFAFLAAVQVDARHSMQDYDISDEEECETDESLSSLADEEQESVQPEDKVYHIANNEKGNCSKCGDSPVGSSTIVNGDIVDPPNKFPWMASLSVNGQRSCGASIISEKFVMTASHCIMKKDIMEKLDENTCVFSTRREGPCYNDAQEVEISFLTKSYELTAGRKVAQIIPHPKYQPDKPSVEHDIALISMTETIQCNDYAMPICLPSPTLPVKTGEIVSIAGWGETKDPNGEGKEQRTTTIKVERSKICKTISGFNSRSSICLSGKGASSACFGDSGGPAFLQTHNKFFAIGIASAHGSEECETSAPVVYTSVANYVEWIKKVSGVDFKN